MPWTDEALTIFAIHRANLFEVVRFQSTTPTVFEPPSFEGIAWLTGKVFGQTLWVYRLPGMMGFTAMQVMLYSLVRRLDGRRALVAFLLPMATYLLVFAEEVRPYGPQMFCSVAIIWLWWKAKAQTKWRAMFLLLLLFGVMFIATTSQFYGVLLILPVAIGEAWLVLRQRQPVDWPLVMVLLYGLATVALDVPALHALQPYKEFTLHNLDVGLQNVMAVYMFAVAMTVDNFYDDILCLRVVVDGFDQEGDWRSVRLLDCGLMVDDAKKPAAMMQRAFVLGLSECD